MFLVELPPKDTLGKPLKLNQNLVPQSAEEETRLTRSLNSGFDFFLYIFLLSVVICAMFCISDIKHG